MSQIKFELSITGMHCAACSSRIERVVGKMSEVDKVSVSLPTNRAQVILKEGIKKSDGVKAVIDRIQKLNFGAKLSEGEDLVKEWQKENEYSTNALKNQFRSLPPMMVLAILILYVSMGHMIGLPLPSFISPETSPLAYAILQLLLVLPVMYLGWHFYRDGFSNLFQGAPNMDSLVAVGTGAAFVYSLFSVFMIISGDRSYCMNLYFESCGVLITMISIGQYMDFVLAFVLPFGFIFELPLIIIIMGYFNLITSQFLKKKRKLFILLSFIIGAVISPTPDMFSQTMIALPMILLYETSLFVLAKVMRR